MANNPMANQGKDKSQEKDKPAITPAEMERRRHHPDEEDVDEASIESFPASDAPAWSQVTTPKSKDKKKSDK